MEPSDRSDEPPKAETTEQGQKEATEIVETASMSAPESDLATDSIAKTEIADADKPATPVELPAVPQSDNPATLPTDRLMLLTEAGPLLVDLRITIDGKPHLDSFDHVVQTVMGIADEDGDGIVTWDTLMNHPRFSDGQFGNPATSTYQAQLDMVRLYDTTKNDRVDPDELIRYLTSNQGTSQALSLVTSNYRRVLNRDDSPIRKWLDSDNDLVIDERELAAAPRRLRLRDTNDDEVLLPEDFVDMIASPDGQMMSRRPRDSEFIPKVGWLIEDLESWSDMRVAWNHYYNRGADVSAANLQFGAEIFDQLDLDDSDSLDNLEMELLADIIPQIEVDIALASGPEKTPEVKLTALRLPPEQTNAVVQHQPNRITIELPHTSLDISARDTIGSRGYEQQAMQFLQQADGDENEYIDEDEFSSIAGFLNNLSFGAADLDGDGKLFHEEIQTNLSQRELVNQNRVSVRADDQDDALFPTVDLNSDGRIDSREIAQIGSSLMSLDRNDDGKIELHELRGTMMIGVVRGIGNARFQPGDTTFQVPAVVRQASESTPRWFRGMDRNRDGGISWREFLGTRQQFDELDADGDGFVLEEEITVE